MREDADGGSQLIADACSDIGAVTRQEAEVTADGLEAQTGVGVGEQVTGVLKGHAARQLRTVVNIVCLFIYQVFCYNISITIITRITNKRQE